MRYSDSRGEHPRESEYLIPGLDCFSEGLNHGRSITKRATDYSQWYLDIVKQAGLAENSDVRGCMVIKPHGYAIWEKMQRALDRLFKDTGHVNAYFPLFIPKSFLAKEEEMAEGFAKECAVVTHYRLKAEPGQGPASSIPRRSSKRS